MKPLCCLQPDQTAADDYHPPDIVGKTFYLFGIVPGGKGENLSFPNHPFDGWNKGVTTGGNEQLVIGDGVTASQPHLALLGIQTGYFTV